MAERQVRIDLVAQDDASATIDKVADKAADLEHADPTVDVAADTARAQRSVDELLDTVQHLDSDDATIVLGLRAGRVQRDLVETLRTVEELDASDPTVAVHLANADQARADLDKLETAIRDLNDTKVAPKVDTSGIDRYRSETGKAQDATHSFVGNAVSELPGVSDAFGPLGEAASQLTEGIAAGEVALGNLAGAAVVIAPIVIGMKGLADHAKKLAEVKAFREETVRGWAKAYRAAAGDVDKFTDALGDAAEQAGKIEVSLGNMIGLRDFTDDIANAGLTADQFFQLVADGEDAIKAWGTASKNAGVDVGAVDGAVLAATASIEPYNDAIEAGKVQQRLFGEKAGDAADGAKDVGAESKNATGKVDGFKSALDRANDELDRMSDALDMDSDFENLRVQLGGMALATAQGVKPARTEINGMKQDIINLARQAGISPVIVQSTLEKLDQGDLQGVLNAAQSWMNQNHVTATVDFKLGRPVSEAFRESILARGGSGSITVTPGAAAAPALVINQTFPRGFRTSSAVAEAQRAAGRAGRLYMRGHLPR